MDGVGEDLPFIDEHRVVAGAPADRVWRAIAGLLRPARTTSDPLGPRRGSASGGLARLLGAEPRRAHGRLFDEGSSVPGFAVTEAEPNERIRLTGRHRFSRYELTFLLEKHPDGTLVRARSYGWFPGPHGWLYRQAVIGSRAHRIVMRRMLREIRRLAEHDSEAGP